jgi:excisionase family DNA binding protein
MKLLLASEAAALLRVTENRIYELAKRGAIPVVRLGRQLRFDEAALLAWIEAGGTPLEASAPPALKLMDSHQRRSERG